MPSTTSLTTLAPATIPLTVEAIIDTCAGKLEKGPDGKYTCVGDETVDAEGKARIGKGSMAVDEIRLVKGEDIVYSMIRIGAVPFK